MTGTAVGTERPFRGLRYFDESDAHLFFGRDAQVDDLLATLRQRRFVAVLGGSGSGKSSLVRAGLVPGLRAGFDVDAGGDWLVVVTRPGNAPVLELASALGEALRLEAVDITLRRGPLGIVEAVRQAALPPGQHVLLVIDQFEELFRFQREAADRRAAAEEAALFVKLLLEAAARLDVPLAVVITMRSDFLGNCAQFRDLPERINDGLYLVPRMRRDQIQEAIVGPLGVVGVTATAPLVQRLLNDVGDDPDQLPVLQHALLRTWQRWTEDADSPAIDLPHYERTGGFERALSDHANEVFECLGAPDGPPRTVLGVPVPESLSRQQQIAVVLFKRLVERDAENRDVRRRATVDEITAVAGANRAEVEPVVEAFAVDGMWVLMRNDDLLDITHESLIRKWDRITGSADRKGWLAEEIEARDAQIELSIRAARLVTPTGEALLAEWQHGPVDPLREVKRIASLPGAFEDVLRGAELERAIEAAKSWAPWPWAARYVAHEAAFARTLLFLEASREARGMRERLEARARADVERDHERQRRRASVIAAGAVTLAIVFGVLAFFVWQFKKQADEQRTQSAQQAATLRTSTIVYGAVAALQRDPMVSALLLREIAPDGAPWIALQVASDTAREGVPRAILRGHTGILTAAVFSRDGQRVATASMDGTARVWKADGTGDPVVLRGHERPVMSVAFNGDGSRLVTASADGTARIWSAAGGDAQAVLGVHEGGVQSAGFSTDSSRVWTIGWDGTARVWGADGKTLATLRDPEGLHVFATWAISPDARSVALASRDTSLRVLCVDASCTPRQLGTTGPLSLLEFTADGRRVVAVSNDSTSVWCLDGSCTSQTYHTPAPPGLGHFAVSDDGAFLAASGAREITVWHLAGEHRPAPAQLPIAAAGTSELAFSRAAGGGSLLALTLDNTIDIWHVGPPSGSMPIAGFVNRLPGAPAVRLMGACRGHAGRVSTAAFDERRELLVTGSADGTARVWPVGPIGEPVIQRDPGGEIADAVFSPNGEHVASVGSDERISIWPADRESPSRTIETEPVSYGGVSPVDRLRFSLSSRVNGIAFSRDGLHISAGLRSRVVVGSTGNQSSPPLVLVPSRSPVEDLTRRLGKFNSRVAWAYSPDGARIVAASADGQLYFWNATDGKQLTTVSRHKADVKAISFNARGDRIVSSGEDGTARLWTGDGRPLAVLSGHDGAVLHAVFSPDGSRVLTASADRTARLWDVTGVGAATGSGAARAPGNEEIIKVLPLRTLAGHTDAVTKAVFNAKGDLAVTVSGDLTGRVWRVSDGGEVAVLNGHFYEVSDVEFSPNGQRILTASQDGTARLWQADGAGEAMVLRGHTAGVNSASFSSDGTRVVTASRDGTTRVWRVDLGGLLGLLRSNKTTVCLQPEERQRFLRESRDAADAAYTACERSHGRTPPERRAAR